MRRTKTGVLPSVDAMESRLLLSTAAPLLARHALTGVVREVRAIVSTLARTDDTTQANAELTGLSAQISSESAGLALAWQIDLGLYRPHSARSKITTEQRIIADLYRYDEVGVGGGSGPVSGSGSGSGSGTSTAPTQGAGGTATPIPPLNTGQGDRGTPTPPAAPSLDSVRIENTTGLALVVTVELEGPRVQQPTITETISAQAGSTVLFDFGTATGDFMTMNVSRAPGGGESPPPWNDINLSQPMDGYDGTLYTISLFGPYFSVNVP
jgi:hypothetical protein